LVIEHPLKVIVELLALGTIEVAVVV